MLPDVSVIVPIAAGETAWPDLLKNLAEVAPACREILLAGPAAPNADDLAACRRALGSTAVAWLETPLGRARQMNKAALQASGRFLWFLHADSRLDRRGVAKLARALAAAPEALHYFDLAFEGRRFSLMTLNQIGVWFRCHGLGLPFGDQGLCLARKVFFEVGAFDESAPYGEDHLLVWQARRAGKELRCTGGRLWTSPRKYRERGWLKTTLRHQFLTYRQALPEWRKSWGGEG